MKKHIVRYRIHYILFALLVMLVIILCLSSASGKAVDTELYVSCSEIPNNSIITTSVVKENLTTSDYAFSEDIALPSPNLLEWKLAAYTYELCRAYDVNPATVFAIMDVESTFRLRAISPTGDYGLMQINAKSYPEYTTDELLDPYRNITIGVGIYAKLVHKYEDEHKALACYNLGETGAKRARYVSKYADKVLAVKEEYVR
jgi:Soluble lytic murein transglycosylase and related regulatory proteins (some contain LysM/invasin domains)